MTQTQIMQQIERIDAKLQKRVEQVARIEAQSGHMAGFSGVAQDEMFKALMQQRKLLAKQLR